MRFARGNRRLDHAVPRKRIATSNMPKPTNETVETPAEETTTPPESTEETGAEETGSEVTPPTGDTTEDTGEGTGTDDGQTPPEDNTKRVNDLMGKWQGEQHDHGKTKTELEVANAQIERLKDNKGQNTEDPNLPSYRRKDWKPENISDIQTAIIEAEEVGARRAQDARSKEHTDADAITTQVNDFIKEVEGADKEFNKDEFYTYATTHNFPMNSVADLRSIYSSFVELRNATSEAGKTAIKNKEKRGETPVGQPNAGGGESQGIPYSQIQEAGSATDLVNAHFGK